MSPTPPESFDRETWTDTCPVEGCSGPKRAGQAVCLEHWQELAGSGLRGVWNEAVQALNWTEAEKIRDRMVRWLEA